VRNPVREMSLIRVMKDESEKSGQGNVPHQGYEGQKREIRSGKCPSSGL